MVSVCHQTAKCCISSFKSQLRELSKEVENGRLLRLLAKINFVVERPQGDVVSLGALLLYQTCICAMALAMTMAMAPVTCHKTMSRMAVGLRPEIDT
jgi:hypothetical protein